MTFSFNFFLEVEEKRGWENRLYRKAGIQKVMMESEASNLVEEEKGWLAVKGSDYRAKDSKRRGELLG